MGDKTAASKAFSQSTEQARRMADSLGRFQVAAQLLSSDHPRLIDEYPDQWVAVCDHAVLAHGNSMESVLNEVDERGIDRARIIVRLIERNVRTLIL